jgi:PAS domain S-box-containing protein
MKKILVVDNDQLILEFMKETLAKEGHTVRTAENGLSALEILKRYVPEVIFVDLVMPNIDGRMLCKIIRRTKRLRDAFVVVLSSIAKEADINASELGADACIAKGPLSDMADNVLNVLRQIHLPEAELLSARCIGIDQMHSRSATEELLAVKRHFEIILERMNEGILEITPEGRIVFANSAAVALTRVSEEKLLGSLFLTLFQGEDRNRISGYLNAGIDSSISFSSDSPCLLNETLVTLNILPIGKDSANSIIIINDITEQKRAEMILRRAHDELEMKVDERTAQLLKANDELERRNRILESLRFSAERFLKTSDWTQTTVQILERLGNATSASRIYLFNNGVDKDGELMANLLHKWVNPASRPGTKNAFPEAVFYKDPAFSRWRESLSLGNPIVGQVRAFPAIEQKRLTALDIQSILIVPVFIGKEWWGFIGFDECRKEREWSPAEIEALRASAGIIGTAMENVQTKERLSLLAAAVEQAVNGVAIADSEGRVQYVNREFEAITGYTREEMVGSHYSLSQPGWDESPLVRDMQSTVRKGEAWRGSYTNFKKDGTRYIEETVVSPVVAAESENRYYVVSNHDVTERRRLESIAEAANLMENIGFVFSGIRHEIGNPINSLKMTLTVLLDNLETFSADMTQEFLRRSLGEIGRVEYLLRALSNFNMFEKLNIQSIEIDSFLDRFLGLVSDEFESRGIKIKKLISEDAGTCLADARALHQVLLNLMGNAADALKGKEDPEIALSVHRSQGLLKLAVQDNGRGIPEEAQGKLFKPFFTSKAKGTGLGLVIVKKMLTKMNGTVDIRSRDNGGTVVTLSIPEA